MTTVRLTYEAMFDTFASILISEGVEENRSRLCAGIIADSTFDGVLSHGIRRFLPLVEAIGEGRIDRTAEPTQIRGSGAVEVWDGGHGIGVINAARCTDRAMVVARRHGVGCVALRNTSHWLRAGSYGWRAVESGFALVCWTNTISNMPAWGAVEKSVGNNPLVVAVPHGTQPIVLDMAMSQFSMGTLSLFSETRRPLPVAGGYDSNGSLTTDAELILASGRALPAGFWKGSGLAIALDALAVLLTGGNATADYDAMGEERDVSQVFIAFAPEHTVGSTRIEGLIGRIAEHVASTEPATPGEPPAVPGQRTLRRRAENRRNGMSIDAGLWSRIVRLVPKGADKRVGRQPTD